MAGFTLITAPVADLTCPQCGGVLRLAGGEPAACCGFVYHLSLAVHQESEPARAAYQAEIARQLARGDRGEPITVPTPPPYTELPSKEMP